MRVGPIRALSAAALSYRAPLLPPPYRRNALLRAHAASFAAPPSSSVQLVYDRAAQGDLDGAAAAMDSLTADDVGLLRAGAMEPPPPGSAPGDPVSYHHVHSTDSLSIGIFVLPPGAALPLHDHPGMTVLSKLLFGSLRVTSYDMPGGEPPSLSFFGGQERRLQCAEPSISTVSAPCATMGLGPSEGNIHAFEALEHTAIFDVLTPPYSDRDGRSCHYYEKEDAGPEGGVVLREVPWPASLRVVNRPYRGPSVLS